MCSGNPRLSYDLKLTSFLGAIQLALNVAARSDKANMALSWIVDGRPQEVNNSFLELDSE